MSIDRTNRNDVNMREWILVAFTAISVIVAIWSHKANIEFSAHTLNRQQRPYLSVYSSFADIQFTLPREFSDLAAFTKVVLADSCPPHFDSISCRILYEPKLLFQNTGKTQLILRTIYADILYESEWKIGFRESSERLARRKFDFIVREMQRKVRATIMPDSSWLDSASTKVDRSMHLIDIRKSYQSRIPIRIYPYIYAIYDDPWGNRYDVIRVTSTQIAFTVTNNELGVIESDNVDKGTIDYKWDICFKWGSRYF